MFPGVFLFLSLPSPPYPGGSFQPNERQAGLGTLSLHGKELSGNCYPEVGRPGNARARDPMGKGRLVPLPESACLSLCLLYSLTSPPVSFLLLCWESPPFPTFLFPLRPSSLKVLVGGSSSPPHAIGWVQSGQVLLPGATVTTSRFLGFPEKVRTMAGRTLALRYGPPWSPISETEVLGTWPNWHLTSSGVAHHWIPPASFPLPTLQVRGWRVR